MAFNCGLQSDKQHINLSTSAYNTVQNDIIAFSSSSITAFINHVFYNYYPDADASVFLSSEKKALLWNAILKKTPNHEKAVALLKQAEEEVSIKKALSYPRGNGIKFRLNNTNYSYLTSEDCQENLYYFRGQKDCAGLYIKAVLEEYAEATFLKREEIYFKSFFETVSDALEQKKQLLVTTQNGEKFYVKPLILTPNKECTYHYLVGLSYYKNENEDTAELHSFRISRIKEIELCRSRSGFIKEHTRSELLRLLEEKDAPFVGNNTNTIVVQLTEQGEKMYNTILHLRPNYIKCEKDIRTYTFECTHEQIKFYFLQFGKHARIISPAHLADEFKTFFCEAYERYNINI